MKANRRHARVVLVQAVACCCMLAIENVGPGLAAPTTLTFQEGVNGYEGTRDTYPEPAAPDTPMDVWNPRYVAVYSEI